MQNTDAGAGHHVGRVEEKRRAEKKRPPPTPGVGRSSGRPRRSGQHGGRLLHPANMADGACRYLAQPSLPASVVPPCPPQPPPAGQRVLPPPFSIGSPQAAAAAAAAPRLRRKGRQGGRERRRREPAGWAGKEGEGVKECRVVEEEGGVRARGGRRGSRAPSVPERMGGFPEEEGSGPCPARCHLSPPHTHMEGLAQELLGRAAACSASAGSSCQAGESEASSPQMLPPPPTRARKRERGAGLLAGSLMYYMKNKMQFDVLDEYVDINDKGDVYTPYDIINWQMNDTGGISFVRVGLYNCTSETDDDFRINNDSIYWNTPTQTRPRSACNDNCQPGYRKGIQQGKPACCYDCIKCAEGQISNETDARECTSCQEDYWSNIPRNECVHKDVEFLAYEDALGMTLIALSVFGAMVVLAVTGVYIKFRGTALVKANDRELSFLIQFSLVTTLLTSILFVGKPENWSCQARQVTLALGFSVCLSCVLGKTVMLFLTHLAKNSKVAEKVRMSMRPIFQKIIVLNSVLTEVGICAAYLVLDPPKMLKNTQFLNVKIIFECDEGSILFLCVMFGFDVFLAILCFLTAFVARKLPNNFNEAKFVTFGMLVFFIVWISFVPAYLSTKGKFKVAVEIFAILASSFGLLGCIFVPKCYIILLKPLRNTEEIVGGKAAMNDKSAPPTSASCTSEVVNTTVSTVLED
ncbi:vomeronasal type-2 receptor 1-like isoform X2 [Hemicordylus capensis]|uniref:vomeronasal type-2 receptor 1-like isoform X2 n=1 Tax=Hemicordylus capensis TaxID=884348 RepID=UPI0023031356|nr:vomeronasal type-2 receptor 1-like isoform X2 [Hemicordylus capensis]